MPKCTVIIPTYNAAEWLKESIDSVLRQTFRDYELIVVDDGSTDNTSSVVNAFGDKRIRYFYKPNGGAAGARNMGIEKATGEYIAFLDSDDLWPESYLQTLIAALHKGRDYGLAYTAMTVVYPDGTVTRHFRTADCVSGWVASDLFRRHFIWPQATVLRRGLFDDFRWDESLKTGSDYDGFLRLSLQTQFFFVRDIEIVRRVREDSLGMHSFSSTVNCNKIRVQERFYYRLGGKDCIPEAEAMRRIARTYMHTAKCYYAQQARRASVHLFRQALSYNLFDLRIITGLLKAVMLKRNDDSMIDWQMPTPLGEPVSENQADTKAPR